MHYVQDPLARQLLAGEFVPGDTIVADRAGEALGFRRELPSHVAAVP